MKSGDDQIYEDGTFAQRACADISTISQLDISRCCVVAEVLMRSQLVVENQFFFNLCWAFIGQDSLEATTPPESPQTTDAEVDMQLLASRMSVR